MNGVLSGMRVVEGSAFVAAPLGGMTLASARRRRDSLRPDRGWTRRRSLARDDERTEPVLGGPQQG